ncbi:thiamine-phosphate kinase [Oceanospirillum sanctuarii]|uniref:thiamine-phosphate kinase n=1 Tax=Oceanospirillum sanctuarii TaxID=1434821 RepID=UPI001594ADD4|nr:thiamine-phosphate kinase [Oceanospirillum sanctuarii]
MGEFELIHRYFAAPELQQSRRDVCVGIGDDCALIAVPQGKQLAVSVDTSVAGVHFLPEAPAHSIGWRALAVSLSDLAAMGAQPAWFTLAISLPEVDEAWLAEFSRGMADLSQRYGVALVGGDTTRGQLSMSVQVQGYVTQGAAWRRKGAKPGDIIYVSGKLGTAAAGLRIAQGLLSKGLPLPDLDALNAEDSVFSESDRAALKAYLYPEPRFDLISVLSSRVSSAIDISDGLLADLGHILTASGVGASLDHNRIPCFNHADMSPESCSQGALSGGDDYELCFTVSPQRRLELEVSAEQSKVSLHAIGMVTAQEGIRGIPESASVGFDHFKDKR